MVVKYADEYGVGYNPICLGDKLDEEFQMDVGIICLDEGYAYTNNNPLERAFLLIEGDVTFKWEGKVVRVIRESCFDQGPICLHVPKDIEVIVEGNGSSDVMYQALVNEREFESKLYNMEDTVSEVFGLDVLGDTSVRTVRTVIDDEIAPYSNLVIGEVINHAGKWSSYPPHHHVQPEVYHYRFLPTQGFGISLIGDKAHKVEHKSTSVITSGLVHPQCSAPGYAMYYVWMIPHSPKRWLKDRTFEEKHTWMLEDNAKIWPYKD